MKKVNIGIFGLGTVGQGVYQQLLQNDSLNGEVTKVVVKRKGIERGVPEHLVSTSPEDVLRDEEIDLVIELIDDAEAAYHIAKKALLAGKSVISANKKMIAKHQLELINLSKELNASFFYEAAVCASIPVIRNFDVHFGSEKINFFNGILNGSTNYILTQMDTKKTSYDFALKQAQENGFAERDPFLDVSGNDALYKLSIVGLHAFGVKLNTEDIICKGITEVTASDFKYAKKNNLKIKLISSISHKEKDDYAALVFPTFVKKQDTLAQIENENNAVSYNSSLAGEQFLLGKGAGQNPTTSAVVGDITSFLEGKNYQFKKGLSKGTVSKQEKGRFYVAAKSKDLIDSSIFESISEFCTEENHAYYVGIINHSTLKNYKHLSQKNVSIIAY